MINEYIDPNTNFQLLDLIEQRDKLLENADLDRKPAAQVRPIKQTHTLATSATSTDPDPVITVVVIIGRECNRSRTISRRRVTKEVTGREVITRSDVSPRSHIPEVIGHRNIIQTDIMDSSIITPSGDGSIPFSSG